MGLLSAGLWTLPPRQVTMHLRDDARFWGDVKAKVKEIGGCDSAQHLLEDGDGFSSLILGRVEVPPSQASVSIPMESM